MYYWGLQANNIEGEKEVLLQDLEYMNSLFELNRYRELKNKAEESDPSVLDDLQQFWQRLDPTPLTTYNERVVEHWQRVNTALEKYKRPNREEFDARGEMYVRHGEPDYVRTGQLNYNSGTVNYYLDQRMTGQLDPFQAESEFYREAMRTMQFNLESRIRTLHEYPNYEIWVYKDLSEGPDHTVYIFGSSNGTVYKKKNSVEDFIPSMAFNKAKATEQALFMQQQSMLGNNQDQGEEARIPNVDITPALIMQLMYYRQFSALDPYFAEAFEDMERRYGDVTTRVPPSLARQFESTNISELLHIQSKAPRQSSTDAREIPALPVRFYAYQFLDESNQPYYKVFIKSDVADAGYFDYLRKNNRLDDEMWNNYSVDIGAQLLGESEQVMEESRRLITLNSRNAENVNTSFNISHQSGGAQLRGAVALYDSTGDPESISENTVFKDGLSAMGENSRQIPEPLPTEGLTMGDIILGYGTNNMRAASDEIPFRIAHERVLPQGQSLKLYYEIYNLSQNANGMSRFSFQYQINAVSKTLFIRREEKSDLSITINNESARSRFTNSLEIKTADLQPGTYELDITVNDLLSDQKINRQLEFEIK